MPELTVTDEVTGERWNIGVDLGADGAAAIARAVLRNGHLYVELKDVPPGTSGVVNLWAKSTGEAQTPLRCTVSTPVIDARALRRMPKLPAENGPKGPPRRGSWWNRRGA